MIDGIVFGIISQYKNEHNIIMKKTLFLAVFALVSIAASAQKDSGFGIKAGLNYNQNGDLIGSVESSGQNILEGSSGRAGFHIGFFGKLDLGVLYIRPELIYTNTTSSYNVGNSELDYKISKIDLPVLVGFSVIGPLKIFVGPAFQYTLNNDLDGLDGLTIENVKNDFSIGYHAGLGVNIGKLGLDVRYEGAFSENQANLIGNNIADISGRVDSRPSQIIFGVSVKL